jgi:ABC-2 type transport system ATP-binding protein
VAENIIELADLTKKYGSFTAVDHLNLNISKGEIFGLLGPNGAGKSTTILMMLGLTDPTSGSVSICGINPTTSPIGVKSIIGYLPEDVGFHYNRTGYENLLFTAGLNSIPGKEAEQRIDQLLNRVGLEDARHKKTGKYSRGMLQRLGLADVLIKNPRIIILDEPTLGLDPTGIREFLDLIVSLSREEGITVLFSSHDLHHVQQVCDRVGLFVKGKLLAEGTIQTLAEKLFTQSLFVIEAGIDQATGQSQPGSPERYSVTWMEEILRQIDGISAVSFTDKAFQIHCSRDAASEIAGAIVRSGAGLNYLNRKEYGLNDIYYRYFEGGDNHE